jgi:hypothetical protein
MSKTENKTKPTKVSVAAFIAKVPNEQRRADSKELVKLFSELTGKPATLWGPTIVGFDSYHYVYESGREGDAPLIGFSPRKADLVIYLATLDDKRLMVKLGKHRASVSCLYVKQLDDIDRAVLKTLAIASIAKMRKRYPK